MVITENQPNIIADPAAKRTAKKFFVLISLNTAITHKMVTSKRRIAVTIRRPPISFSLLSPDMNGCYTICTRFLSTFIL